MAPCAHLRTRGPRCQDCGGRRPVPVPALAVPAIDGLDELAVLGAGATAIVVQARDRSGRRVIAKLARDADGDRALAHEAEALTAIGPPLVPGLRAVTTAADGRRVLVLDDDGGAGLVERLGPPADPASFDALAGALLAAVDALHARGWVHGDLKAEHVRLRPDGAVVLIDLGAARPIGARPDRPVVGSIETMAPELLASARPIADPAADRYAVGAILHELAVGRPPFVGSPDQLRAGHLEQRPWIDRHPDAAAPAVVATLRRLLAKDPAQRGGPATSAASTADRPAEPAPGAIGADLAPPPIVLDAPMVGRERPLAALVDSARGAIARAMPTLATVVAEPGAGKTRFAAVLAGALRELGAVVTIAGAGGGSDQAAHALAAAAFGPAWHTRAALADALGPALADELEPGVAASRGLRTVDPGPSQAAIGAAPGAIRAALVRAIGLGLQARARAAPLVIVLDDAHLADDAALDACEYATAAGPELPIWIAALARPELDELRPGWGERAERHERVKLPPLAPPATGALIRALLAPATEIPDAMIERIAARTGGVPLVIHEVVAGLRRAGALQRHQRGDAWFVRGDVVDEHAAPPSIDELAARELAAMGPSLAAYARLCAIAGPPITAARLGALVDRLGPDGDALALDPAIALAQLRRRGLLADGGGFRHALIGEALARAPGLPATAAIHAAAFALTDPADPDALPARARHARGAGLAAAALVASRALAERALARHAYLEADRELGHVLALLETEPESESDPDPERERAAACRARGEARFRVGRNDDALADLAAATARSARRGDRHAQAEALLARATVLDWIDEFAAAAAEVARAAALIDGAAPAPLRGLLAIGRGRTAWRAGDPSAAATALADGLAITEGAGDAAYPTRTVGRLLLATLQAGPLAAPDDAAVTFAALIADCEAHRDRLHLAAALNNRRHLWLARGELDPMLADAERVIAIGRELGLLAFEYGARINAGEALLRAGRLADARRAVELAIAVERRRSRRLTARLLDVRLLLHEGRRADAALAHAAVRADHAAGGVFTADDTLFDRACAAALGAAGDWDALLAAAPTARDRAELAALRGFAA